MTFLQGGQWFTSVQVDSLTVFTRPATEAEIAAAQKPERKKPGPKPKPE